MSPTKPDRTRSTQTRPQRPAAVAKAVRRGELPFDVRAAVRYLRRNDPRLGELITRVGPCTLDIPPLQSLFDALARAIVYQQLTGKAASTIFGRVRTLLGSDDALHPEDVAAASEESLRGAGLSRNKMLALKDLAAKTLAGAIPSLETLEGMEDEEIIEGLTLVRGVGRWTAEMVLIFRLGRPNVLPVDDLGVRKGFAKTFGKRALPSAKALEKHARVWEPYRSVASWYLWRAV